MPAKVLANINESLMLLSSHSAVAKAPLNASPAPDVSTTLLPKSKGGT